MISAVWASGTGSAYQSCRFPFLKFREGEGVKEGEGNGVGETAGARGWELD